ncbi:hypothetical protein V8F06_003473 [Rhypophila decipiens]
MFLWIFRDMSCSVVPEWGPRPRHASLFERVMLVLFLVVFNATHGRDDHQGQGDKQSLHLVLKSGGEAGRQGKDLGSSERTLALPSCTAVMCLCIDKARPIMDQTITPDIFLECFSSCSLGSRLSPGKIKTSNWFPKQKNSRVLWSVQIKSGRGCLVHVSAVYGLSDGPTTLTLEKTLRLAIRTCRYPVHVSISLRQLTRSSRSTPSSPAEYHLSPGSDTGALFIRFFFSARSLSEKAKKRAKGNKIPGWSVGGWE